MRRLCFSFVVQQLAFITSLPAQMDIIPNAPAFLLVDYSYSMTLPVDVTHSRLDLLLDAALENPIVAEADGRLGILAFDDRGRLEILLAYPARLSAVRKALRTIAPFGTSPVFESIRGASRYLRESFPDIASRLILVSDCEDDSTLMLDAAPVAPVELVEGSVELSLFTLADRGPASASQLVIDWTELSGGAHFLIVADGAQARTPEADVVSSHEQPRVKSPFETDTSDHTPEKELPTPLRSAIRIYLFVALCSFAAAAVAGLILLILLSVRRQLRNEKVARHNAQPPRIALLVRGLTGHEVHEVTRFPATLGTGIGNTVNLGPKGKSGDVRCRLTLVDQRITFSSDKRYNVNGVPRTERDLEPGDQIRMGNYRVLFESASVTKQIAPESLSYLRFASVPLCSALLALAAFALLSAPSAGFVPEDFDSTGIPPTSTLVAIGSLGSDGTPSTPAGSAVQPRSETIIVSPGDPLPDVDLDFLAFHAHPDDESLDYGALLARFTSAGMHGGVVLMTDGGGGRDQYPRRPISDTYPGYDLAGRSLSQVRVKEAAQAMGWIGVDFYFRLGLVNSPYNGVDDQLDPAAVFALWGGRQSAVSQIAGLINELSPEIILSPDGPRGPYEHFEHEATGLLVWEAIRQVRRGPESPVRAHIVSVDPLQSEHYDRVQRISPWDTDPRTALPYRVTQLLALSEHMTQRDASVVGVETRMGLLYDFVAIGYWDSDYSLPKSVLPVASAALSEMALSPPRPVDSPPSPP